MSRDTATPMEAMLERMWKPRRVALSFVVQPLWHDPPLSIRQPKAHPTSPKGRRHDPR